MQRQGKDKDKNEGKGEDKDMDKYKVHAQVPPRAHWESLSQDTGILSRLDLNFICTKIGYFDSLILSAQILCTYISCFRYHLQKASSAVMFSLRCLQPSWARRRGWPKDLNSGVSRVVRHYELYLNLNLCGSDFYAMYMWFISTAGALVVVTV